MPGPERTPPQVDLRDLVALAGAGTMTYGVYLLNASAALVVGGALLIAIALLSTRVR